VSLASLAALALLASCSPSTGRATPPAGPVGGTLRVAITQPGSLDPGNAYEPQGMLVDSLLCEPLLSVDPATGKLRPGLASNWVVSDHGTRITLRLRKARFSNGARVTSDDVIASLSRAAGEDFAGNAASLLEPIIGWDEITGRKDTSHERDHQVLAGVTAIDGSSLTINLKRRDADFLRVLAHPVAAPVPQAAHEPEGFEAQPVCAGPYKLAGRWAPADTLIRLVRNPRYHARNPVFSNGGRGYADEVDFKVYPSADAAFAAWQAGEVDVAAVPPGRRADVAPGLLHEALSGYVDYIGVPASGPLADPKVRVALSMAIDRSAAAAPSRKPAAGFLPPFNGCGRATPAAADVVGAQAMLAQAKVDLRGVDLDLAFNDELGNRAVVQSVADQWQKAFGLRVSLKPTPFDELAAQAATPQGIKGAFREGWQPAVTGPEAYIGPLFTSAGIGTDNFSRFVDPAVQRVLDREARSAGDESDRALAYKSVERQLCHVMPLIPVDAGVSRWATRAWGSGRTTLDRDRGWPVLRELYHTSGESR
jgi:ABC-type transport system substrate-binding protein